MPQKGNKPRQRTRPPRIRVPNSERALFVMDDSKFVGVIQRLSLTGGSAILAKGPIPQGTLGKMGLNTVFGQVTAQIEFLQMGADGIPLAQAFRFVAMSDISSERFTHDPLKASHAKRVVRLKDGEIVEDVTNHRFFICETQ